MSATQHPNDEAQKKNSSTDPIKQPEEVSQHPDPKIDADHPGFPHGQATEKTISPKTNTEKETAAVDVTDGEKKDRDEL